MSTPAALSKLRVAELRERLEAHGLSTEGTKPILLTRLKEALNKSLPLPMTPTKSESEESVPAAFLDTPKRRSKRVSLSESNDRVATPIKKSKVLEAERPSTPIRRSRRLSGDLPQVPEELIATPAVPTIETIEEDAEENVEEPQKNQKSPEKVIKVQEKDLKSAEKVSKTPEKPLESPKKSMVQNVEQVEAASQVKEISKDESKKAEEESKPKQKESKAVDKENLPMEVLLENVFIGKHIPRQKPKSGRFWKGERGQFRQIKRDKGQRNTFEQRLAKKEEMRKNKELADMMLKKKNQAREELRKRIEENKAKKLENERKTEQYQIIKNPAKLKRMKKKQLRMLEKRDILA